MKNNGVSRQRAGSDREPRSATSSATTRAKPACVRWSARSPRSAARWSRALLLKKADGKVAVDGSNLDKFLGVRQYNFGVAEKENQVGQVTGLAWTEVGGELLTIEAAPMPGKGNVIRTGSLGDVMKESVEAARTVVRSRARRLGIKDEVFEKSDMHIHVPEGATPKDGPSAGIAMTTAHRFDAHRHPGARRRRDDRRNHAARRSPADRRPEGKAAGGAARRHQDGADPGRERQGSAGNPGQREEQDRNRSGEVDRPGAGNGARRASRSRFRTRMWPPSRHRPRPSSPIPSRAKWSSIDQGGLRQRAMARCRRPIACWSACLTLRRRRG